ncbi:LCP family protein [Solwaraspora sp. WMMD1047]|uniref:LCP family protein n=1 Tax=Solwaraspora sp. WMMD1047 TaxID=3016102 RepID=UPI00241626EC|nr:LCP family protein [Solwaraspora sp. WMMD1047]MDG4831655.1 LCP family protein [Solwaraspora sp. WMMD1047]
MSLLALVLLGAGGVVAAGFYVRSVESDIARIDAFENVPEESRPEKVVQEAKNLLILGSDSRDPENLGGSRSDTIIVAHLPEDRSSAQLISIPRDTWVKVPEGPNGQPGGQEAKINASYAWGGIPLMVQTVEDFTGVRIDHVVTIDFAGFQEIIDALDGIEIDVPRNFTSLHEPFRTFKAGRQEMDGATALDYARQRKQFADGDFARIRNQQQVIKAVLQKGTTAGVLTNPGRLNAFVKSTADAVSIDESLSIFDLAMELRDLRPDDLTFFTSPTSGTGRVGTESVVFADTEKVKTFYDAVRRDAVPEILATAR